MKIFLIIPLVMLVLVMGAPFSQAQSVPDWVKNTAGWWATDAISETEFVNAIQFLVNDGIIQVNVSGIKVDDEFCSILQNELGINQNIKNKLCDDFFDDEFSNISRFPSTGATLVPNSYGFRGPEFSENKPDDTFRIFVVGESTTFGSSNDDSKTIPYLLQENFRQLYPTLNIEVVNAGVAANGNSLVLTNLIKEKIVNLSPDLIIVHNAIQDMDSPIMDSKVSAQIWHDRWMNICNLGKINEFETIITNQPFVGTGNKILSSDEFRIYVENDLNLKIEKYKPFIEKLKNLNQYCSKSIDLSTAFDNIEESVLIDAYHFGDKGSKILADKFFEISKPNVEKFYGISVKKSSINNMEIENAVDILLKTDYSLKKMNFEELTLKNKDFSNKDLSNSSFYNTNLENVNFAGAKMKNTNFAGANLTNVNFKNTSLIDSNIINTQLINVDFEGANLTNSFLFHVVFENVNLSNSNISNAKILDSNFNNNNLNDVDFTNTEFYMTGTVYDIVLKDSKKSESYKPIMIREQYGEIIIPTDVIFFPAQVWIWPNSEEGFDTILRIDNFQLYDEIEITNDEKNSVVIFPEASLYPYSKPCVWNYYIETTSDCFTIPMLRESEKTYKYILENNIEKHTVDFTKPSAFNYQPFNQRADNEPDKIEFGGKLLYETSNLGAQALDLLGYKIISDLEIEKNPQILNDYDKVIVLHSKYVTKTMFNSITSHPKVIYLYPDSLVEEIEIDFFNNQIIVLSPLKFPEEKNFQNDFKWKYDSEHLKYVKCDITGDAEIKFEKVDNGIMLNCYPESNLLLYPDLFKIIKEF